MPLESQARTHGFFSQDIPFAFVHQIPKPNLCISEFLIEFYLLEQVLYQSFCLSRKSNCNRLQELSLSLLDALLCFYLELIRPIIIFRNSLDRNFVSFALGFVRFLLLLKLWRSWLLSLLQSQVINIVHSHWTIVSVEIGAIFLNGFEVSVDVKSVSFLVAKKVSSLSLLIIS